MVALKIVFIIVLAVIVVRIGKSVIRRMFTVKFKSPLDNQSDAKKRC